MAREYTVSIGSGTLPNVGPVLPSVSGFFPEGTYPVPGSKEELRSLVGTASVIVNPEDFSLHIGLRQQAMSVTSAVALPSTPLEYRRSLVIHNNGGDILYIGGSDVTTANGFPLIANEKIAIDIQGHGGVVVYGVSAGTSDVRILEFA